MAKPFRFVPNPVGVAELLQQPGITTYTHHVTETLMQTAIAGSPRRTGHFSESYSVSFEDTPAGVVGSLHNSDPGATAIEFGSVNNRPFAPMRRAARVLGLTVRGDS